MRVKIFLLWFLLFSTSIAAADNNSNQSIYLKKVADALSFEPRYQKLDFIGNGVFGFVYHYGDHVVKISALDHVPGMISNILEASLLCSLFHPAIPTPIDVVIHQGLEKYLEIHLPYYQENVVTRDSHDILEKMSSLLGYLHKINIAHRDIKPMHILEGVDNYKLIDWGAADIFVSDPIKNIATPFVYRSPELLLGDKNFTKENDIWSLGVSLLEIMSNKEIFSGNEQMILAQMLMPITIPSDSEEEFEEIPPNKRLLSIPFQKLIARHINRDDIIRRLFRVDPQERINADELNKHFGKKEKWPNLLLPPPKSAFLDNKTEEFALRHEVFLWMHELANRFQFPPKIIFEAMSMADQFFATSVISAKTAYAVGAISFYLAAGFYKKHVDVTFLVNEVGLANLNVFDQLLVTFLRNARFKLIFNHSLRQFQRALYQEMSFEQRDMVITVLLLLEWEEMTFNETNEMKWIIAMSILKKAPSEKALDYVRVLCQRFQNGFIATTPGFKALLKKIPLRRKSRTLELPTQKESGF